MVAIPKPPKIFLVDSFEYYKYIGMDDNSKPIYEDEPVTIEFCRIDRTTEYGKNGNDDRVLYNGLIFCYADLTEAVTDGERSKSLPDFVEKSKIVYDNQEKTVNKVIEIQEPYSTRLYSFELEVI